MFIGIIASIVVILFIMAYMSTSTMVVDAKNVKIAYEKVKFNYPIEKVISNSIENLCQKDPQTCKDNYDSGTEKITLTFDNLIGYIPTNFVNDNIVGGTYNILEILDNNTTIRITQDIPDTKARYIYLHHYKGREYGIAPLCVTGDKDSVTVCDDIDVFHDFPTSLETRAALE